MKKTMYYQESTGRHSGEKELTEAVPVKEYPFFGNYIENLIVLIHHDKNNGTLLSDVYRHINPPSDYIGNINDYIKGREASSAFKSVLGETLLYEIISKIENVLIKYYNEKK